jgi:hypothetical protein
MAHDPHQNNSRRRGEKDSLTGGGYPAGQKPTKGVPPVPAGLRTPRTPPLQRKRPT